MSNPLKGFITYSHEDTAAKDKLITRLVVMKQQNELVTWHDNEMLPSDKWREEIFSTHLPDSDLLLYLVSAASLASENCNKELGIALKKNIKPIPIILEDCDWKKHQLGQFQALPDRGRPINEWVPDSKGWQNVIEGIRKFVEAMQAQVNLHPGTSEEELRAELAFQQGNVLMMIGQVEMAIERYSHAIEFNPNHASTYNNRGATYEYKGDIDHAIDDYTKSIYLNPNDAIAYGNRGGAYRNKGAFDRAIDDCNIAIDLKPDYPEAYNNRGLAYYYKGDINRAIDDYTKAINLNPNYAGTYNNRGIAYDRKGEVDRAIEDYAQSIQLKPDYADAYNNRGLAYSNKDDGRAVGDFNTAIDLKPNYPEAFNNRGMVYVRLGDFDRAISDFTKAIELDPNNTNAHNNLRTAKLNRT